MTSSSPLVPGSPQRLDRRLAAMSPWRRALTVVVAATALLWFVGLVDLLSGGRLDDHGIRPRSFAGLAAVVYAPLLHDSVGHLVSNTVPLLVLGFVGLVGHSRRFLGATVIAWLTSGLGVWLLASSHSSTVGASGVLYGWMAYLIVRGWVGRNVGQALVGAAILVYFGVGALFSALPFVSGSHVSWQAHLFGAAGGVLAAYLLDAREHPWRRAVEPAPPPAAPEVPLVPPPDLPPTSAP